MTSTCQWWPDNHFCTMLLQKWLRLRCTLNSCHFSSTLDLDFFWKYFGKKNFPPQRINLTNWKKQLDRKSNPETFFFESGRLKKPDIRYTKYFFPQAAQIASRATIYFFLRIDSNVEDTQLNVEAAHSEILKYFQSVSSNRWLMIKIFLVLVVFFIIFVVFFAWARKNRKHGGEKSRHFVKNGPSNWGSEIPWKECRLLIVWRIIEIFFHRAARKKLSYSPIVL